MENNNLILTKENFFKIFDLVKMLKKNIIQVELESKGDGCIVIKVYGTDSDLSSVSYIYCKVFLAIFYNLHLTTYRPSRTYLPSFPIGFPSRYRTAFASLRQSCRRL